MDLSKHLEFFNPIKLEDSIHIIGVGAIGSNLAETIARLGLTNIHLYDFDVVNKHNVANQLYFDDQIDKPKVECIAETMRRINPDIDITIHDKGWSTGTKLAGYVFLAVDDIEIRKQIVKENRYNTSIKAMFDFRMGLEDAQHYACDWSNQKNIDNFYASMDFTHEEAKEATPISACGTTLSVISTIRIVVSSGISNFINFVKGEKLKTMIIANAFKFNFITF
jgi:molybdopterin/thiamine biosynthesis adenylyltransferase